MEKKEKKSGYIFFGNDPVVFIILSVCYFLYRPASLPGWECRSEKRSWNARQIGQLGLYWWLSMPMFHCQLGSGQGRRGWFLPQQRREVHPGKRHLKGWTILILTTFTPSVQTQYSRFFQDILTRLWINMRPNTPSSVKMNSNIICNDQLSVMWIVNFGSKARLHDFRDSSIFRKVHKYVTFQSFL